MIKSFNELMISKEDIVVFYDDETNADRIIHDTLKVLETKGIEFNYRYHIIDLINWKRSIYFLNRRHQHAKTLSQYQKLKLNQFHDIIRCEISKMT